MYSSCSRSCVCFCRLPRLRLSLRILRILRLLLSVTAATTVTARTKHTLRSPAQVVRVLSIHARLEAAKRQASSAQSAQVRSMIATERFDKRATRTLTIGLSPLVAGWALYALLEYPHKGWYSWLVSSLADAIYLFGFIAMTPQAPLPTSRRYTSRRAAPRRAAPRHAKPRQATPHCACCPRYPRSPVTATSQLRHRYITVKSPLRRLPIAPTDDGLHPDALAALHQLSLEICRAPPVACALLQGARVPAAARRVRCGPAHAACIAPLIRAARAPAARVEFGELEIP